jgi:hypothetical protein
LTNTGILTGQSAVSRGRAGLIQHLPVVLLSGFFLVAAGLKAARSPLWFDEIVTYSVSSLEGPGAIVQALLGRMDNHPPLDYLARHLSMTLFGPSELAFRLPSMIGVLVAAVCLYVFVLRRTSVLPALVAFTLPFTTMVLKYSYEGRGYALLMASMALALLAWQLASDKPSIGRLIFLTVALSLGPFSHFYGVLNYAPIAAGEAWRWWERRRIAWPNVGCFVVSLASLALLVPFALNAASFSGTFWTKLSPNHIAHGYSQLFLMMSPGVVGALLAFALAVFLPSKEQGSTAANPVPRHEIVAAAVLCLLPFTTYVLALLVTHAYTYKYLLNTVFGVAILAAYAVHYLAAWRMSAAVLTALAIGLWAAASMSYLGLTASTAGRVTAQERQVIEGAERPLVVLNGHDFLRLNHYLPPRLRAKVFFPSDREGDIQEYGHDTNHRALANLKPFAPMNFVDMCAFTTKHRDFIILESTTSGPSSPSWAVGRFVKEGARITVLSSRRKGAMALDAKLAGPSGC